MMPRPPRPLPGSAPVLLVQSSAPPRALARRALSTRLIRARGFTLLEVLVSLAILAFGLLGVAGLQVAGLRNSHNSDSRTTALFLAYEIIDRIHANHYSCQQNTVVPVSTATGFSGDCYDWTLTPAAYNGFATTVPASGTCFGAAANCASTNNASQLATFDLWDWEQRVATMLPRGEAVVCNDSTPSDGAPSWVSGGGPSSNGYKCDGLAKAANACATCGAVAPVLTVKVWWDERLKNNGTVAADAANTYRRLYLTFQP